MESEKMDLEQQQYQRMTEAPVKSLIMKLAVPTIISMLVTGLYNTADTYFVSQLGKSVSGAVGIVFSLMAIIQAIGFTLGMGSGSIVSRALGNKDRDKANTIASNAFFLALGLGSILTLLGLIFIEPFMSLLGATETILPYAVSYGRYIIFAIPIMAASFVLNVLLRSEGAAKFSMIGLTFGGILNIFLDPLFINTFNLGIAGAAIATIISQFVSFAILLSFFLFKKSIIHLSIRHVSFRPRDYFDILKTGAPSFFRQGLASIATILLNTQAKPFGDAAISGMSIVTKIFMMIFCVALGVGQGYQPVVGYNYSAKKWSRLKEGYLFTWLVGTLAMTTLGAIAFIFAPTIVGLFINDAEVVAIGSQALKFQAIAMVFVTTGVVCNMTFQAMGKKLLATILSCCRQGIFFIPLVLILPKFLGLLGLEMVQAASDILTFITCLPIAIIYLKKIDEKVGETNEQLL